MIVCCLELYGEIPHPWTTVLSTLGKALQDVVEEIEAWARQHETEGRYKDAAYLYGRIHSDLESSIVPTLAAVYEKLGDLPAAEIALERSMGIIVTKGLVQSDEKQIREVDEVSRLFDLFHRRFQVLGSISQTYAKLTIVYRAAVLDSAPLNRNLFDQGLVMLDRSDQCNCCSLHVAVRKNAPNLVHLLLQHGANPNLKDDVGATPLHLATRNKAGEIVQMLLSHRADPEIKHHDGSTPLHLAVRNKAGEIVRLLLNHGAETKIKNKDGSTALHIALFDSQDVTILSYLIEKNADIEARDSLGRTPLCNAIVSNSPTFARYLIRHGADADALCDASNTLGTLLFEAVRQRREWAVEALLDGGAHLRARDSTGRQALYYAVRRGQESMVKVFLDHGAAETRTIGPVSTSGSTLLHCAMIEPNLTIVEMILKAGFDVNEQDLVGDTALHNLMRTGEPPLERIVNLLIDHGAQVDFANNAGDTPLHLAVLHGRSTIWQTLLDAGADPHRRNYDGHTPSSMMKKGL